MNFFTKFTLSLISSSFICIAPQVIANHECAGQVTKVGLNGTGAVYATISNIGSDNVFCSLSENMGEFNRDACSAIYSMLLTAQASKQNIKIWFRNDSNTSCSKGNWQNLPNQYGLYYVRLEG